MLSIRTVAKRDDLGYDIVGSLGGGGYATVLEAKRRLDGTSFAMKIMYTRKRTRAALTETLREEVNVIKALEKHHHFIKVYDAYDTAGEIGLIVWPVADRRSLAHCIEEYLETSSSRPNLKPIFARAFGCLSTGLAFMHQNKFRHKDIKPANILVHRGHILCEFATLGTESPY